MPLIAAPSPACSDEARPRRCGDRSSNITVTSGVISDQPKAYSVTGNSAHATCGVEGQVQCDVAERGDGHDLKAPADLSPLRHTPCQAAAHPGTRHHAGDRHHEVHEELRRLEPQVRTQPLRRTQHVEKEAVERQHAHHHERDEARAAEQTPVAAHQRPDAQRLATLGRQGLRQPRRARQPQQQADAGQKPEDRGPAQVHEQHAADQRGQRGRDAEEQRHLRHHALRIDRIEQVAHDGARHHHAGAARKALQHAPGHQRADVVGERAADRGQREHADAGQDHRPTPEAVGQRTMEQVHHRDAEQIRRQRLLHLQRAGRQRCRDAGERRQVGVDRKRPDRAQAAQQRGQHPARTRPVGGVVNGRGQSGSVCVRRLHSCHAAEPMAGSVIGGGHAHTHSGSTRCAAGGRAVGCRARAAGTGHVAARASHA